MDLPELPPMEDAELIELAQSTMHDAKFPFLSSVDGDQARVRPVSPVRLDHFTVYVANLKFYKKTEELAINPKVELCYMAGNHDQVRITGIAELVDDRGTMIEIWDSNPLLRKYLGSVDNPQLIIYRIIPNQVRYMKEWALEYYDVKFSV